MDPSWPGVRYVQQIQATHGAFVLQFWQMDQSWPGAIKGVVVTVLRFKISSGMCSRFRPHMAHLLQAAILADGSVVTWGSKWTTCGLNLPYIPELISICGTVAAVQCSTRWSYTARRQQFRRSRWAQGCHSMFIWYDFGRWISRQPMAGQISSSRWGLLSVVVCPACLVESSMLLQSLTMGAGACSSRPRVPFQWTLWMLPSLTLNSSDVKIMESIVFQPCIFGGYGG